MSNRRQFLNTLSKTLVAGVGLAAIPAVATASTRQHDSTATAETSSSKRSVSFRCCANATTCGGGCSSGVKYYCVGGGCNFCTGCVKNKPNCYNVLYPSCP